MSIIIISLSTQRDPIIIFLIFVFAFLSIIIVELDYFIHSYFLDPDIEFSKNFKVYIKDKDIIGALVYANLNEDSITEKTIHSALFQGIFGLFSIFVIYSDSNIFFKSLIISTFANLLYKYIEYNFTKNIQNWFWAFNFKVNEKIFYSYLFILISILIICIMGIFLNL